jgi:hypothetical protein
VNAESTANIFADCAQVPLVPQFLLDLLRTEEFTSKLEAADGFLAAIQYQHTVEFTNQWGTQTTMLEDTLQQAFPKGTSMTKPQYKRRSVNTAMRYLQVLSSFAGNPLVVLFGDSMFERMTTGCRKPKCPPVLRPSTEALFNFSVGGDGVEHLLCRMQLMHKSYFSETPVCVVMIGINNLMGAKKGNEAGSEQSGPEDVVEAIRGVVRFISESSTAAEQPTIFLCKVSEFQRQPTVANCSKFA